MELLWSVTLCWGGRGAEIFREGASSYCLVSWSKGEQIQDGCFTVMSIGFFPVLESIL